MCGNLAKQKQIKKYFEWMIMFIHIFLSTVLCKGGEFTMNTTKHCLFRLIELQPGKFLF